MIVEVRMNQTSMAYCGLIQSVPTISTSEQQRATEHHSSTKLMKRGDGFRTRDFRAMEEKSTEESVAANWTHSFAGDQIQGIQKTNSDHSGNTNSKDLEINYTAMKKTKPNQ